MQQLPQLLSPGSLESDKGKLVEDLQNRLGILKRGWRFIAITVVICMTLAIVYLARTKPMYEASARLLVLQQGGRPVNVAAGGDPLQFMQTAADSLSTHVMIIRSPVIVERAIISAGLRGLPADSVIARLTIKVPDEGARVLEVGYKAGTEAEAVRVTEAVIESYDQFLKDNYQKNTTEMISSIVKARDELSEELKGFEQEYLGFRQENPAYAADEDGRSFVARRLDQWDQASNQAMIRALQLKSQLELGQKLAGEGVGAAAISSALNQLGGLGGDGTADPVLPGVAVEVGLSDDRLDHELRDVELQRLLAESLLAHLRADLTAAASSRTVSDTEVVRVFSAEPETTRLFADLRSARARLASAERLIRRPGDPVLAVASQRVRQLERELDQRQRQRRPELLDQLARQAMAEEGEATRKAEADLIALRAKEAALRETRARLRSDHLRQLRQEQQRLSRMHGPQHATVRRLQEQIAKIEGTPGDAPGRPEDGPVRTLLESVQRSLGSLEAMRAEIQSRFEQDLAEAKKTEIITLTESNLRNNLERQRIRFNSVVDQLKQAQVVTDFGSVTAQTLNPPAARTIRPPKVSILLAALVFGCGLGGGMAFLADLLDARIRSLAEMRRALGLPTLGVVPQLRREQHEAIGEIGLIGLAMPRSILSESYKSIRTSLEFLRRKQDVRVLLVTSPQSGDGKSTTASNLAITLALAGRKVLLVDADLRRPSQHRIYNLGRDRGLTQVLKDLMPFSRAVQPTPVENLDLLAVGPEVSNPAELLASGRLDEFLREVRQVYDLVILDSSPLLAVTDPSIIAAAVDGIILVARSSVTRRHEAERTAELLKILGIPVLGSVINGVTCEQAGYGYGDGYGTDGASSPRRGIENSACAPRAERVNGTADHPILG